MSTTPERDQALVDELWRRVTPEDLLDYLTHVLGKVGISSTEFLTATNSGTNDPTKMYHLLNKLHLQLFEALMLFRKYRGHEVDL